jgi:hypothetical protein
MSNIMLVFGVNSIIPEPFLSLTCSNLFNGLKHLIEAKGDFPLVLRAPEPWNAKITQSEDKGCVGGLSSFHTRSCEPQGPLKIKMDEKFTWILTLQQKVIVM